MLHPIGGTATPAHGVHFFGYHQLQNAAPLAQCRPIYQPGRMPPRRHVYATNDAAIERLSASQPDRHNQPIRTNTDRSYTDRRTSYRTPSPPRPGFAIAPSISLHGSAISMWAWSCPCKLGSSSDLVLLSCCRHCTGSCRHGSFIPSGTWFRHLLTMFWVLHLI